MYVSNSAADLRNPLILAQSCLNNRLGLGVGDIVLLALDEWLHIDRWDQAPSRKPP
jgi:hypothetical protein